MTYQNYSLKQLQQIDAAHHLHPFTDHKELRDAGSRIITRADGPFIYDSEGNEILDGMAGLWCVNIGYGRQRARRSRGRADERAALLQFLLPLLDADAGAAGAEDRRDRAGQHEPGVLRLVGLGGQRHGAPPGAPLLGARRQAGEEPHHLAQHGLSRLDGGRRLARRHGRHACAARRRGAQHRPCHDALRLRAGAAGRERP